MYQNVSTSAEKFNLWVLHHIEIPMNGITNDFVPRVSITEKLLNDFIGGIFSFSVSLGNSDSHCPGLFSNYVNN